MLFVDMIQDDYFDVLRTKEQLGYSLSITYMKKLNTILLYCYVQSSKLDFDSLKTRMDKYFIDLKINNDDFEIYKKSLIDKFKLKSKTMGDQFFYNLHLMTLSLDLSWYDKLSEEVNKLTINDVIDFHKQYILLNKKIIIYIGA
jgi:nardilysin